MFLMASYIGTNAAAIFINCAECSRKMLSVKSAIVFCVRKTNDKAVIKTIQCERVRFSGVIAPS